MFPGDSAPVDPIGIGPGLLSSSTQDFSTESPFDKRTNMFYDAAAENEAITLADLPLKCNVGENGGAEAAWDVYPVVVDEEFDSRIGKRSDAKEGTLYMSRNAVEEEFGPRTGQRPDVKEAAMAAALINGLHHVEHGGFGKQLKIETFDQHSEVRQHTSDDRGAESVASPKRVDNGSESQRPGGAGDHLRKPPRSGSHGQRSSDGPEGYPSRLASGKNLVGDVLYSIASEDEEGRSRQRILAFAAKRYSTAVERNPDDHDALYNWALVLQESADNTGAEAGNSAKDSLLEEACGKYQAATELCPTLHEAFYNWAIAISDRAKIRGRTKEAEELWKQACDRYDKSVQLNWNSPQALNNWGLALQELGAIVPLKEKQAIVKKAIRKFRSAIQLRFDFHRAVYNLGTVLYGLAEDTVRVGRKLSAREPSPNDLYSQSAIYIASAHALKPDYPVYKSALRLVRPMLPLPFVKAGFLSVPPVGDSLAPHSDWQRLWFVLNHEALYEMEKVDRNSMSRRSSGIAGSSSSSSSFRPPVVRIEMEEIVFMTPSADLSLPLGGGFRIDTSTGYHYLIADTWEAMDGWVDAIRLVYTIFARGKRDSLAGVLAG